MPSVESVIKDLNSLGTNAQEIILQYLEDENIWISRGNYDLF